MMSPRTALLPCLVCGAALACGTPAGPDASADAPSEADGGPGRILDLVTSGSSNCVVLVDGRLVCWGGMFPDGPEVMSGIDQADLGDGALCVRRGVTVECSGPPIAPGDPLTRPPTEEYIDVGVSSYDACGRTRDRRVVCWGLEPNRVFVPFADELRVAGAVNCVRDGMDAACWFESDLSARPIPGNVSGLAPPNAWARCGLDTRGEVTCETSCLVEGDPLCPFLDWETSVGPGPGGPFVQLELPIGSLFACGLRPSGEIACWGDDYENRRTPTIRELEPEGERFRDIGVGESHVCGVTLDERVVCWGQHDSTIDVPEELR